MGVIIPESDMNFGSYKENQVFQIEISEQYTKKLRQEGVRCCEFILLRSNKLYFIEAKKSYPDPIGGVTTDEKEQNFNRQINAIVEKMRHSLELFANILLGRYSQDGISEEMKNAKEILLILVIKNAHKSWLVPLQDKFRKELKAEMHIWKIQNFFILNEEMARKKHLIL